MEAEPRVIADNGFRHLSETLELTHAFVAVLLAERPGPLTPVQRDLLATIQNHVSQHLQPAERRKLS